MKVKFHGHKKVKFAFWMAAMEHNTGYKSASLLDKILGGETAARGLEIQEERRIMGSTKENVERRKTAESTEDSDYTHGGH
ncbi:hypothetical protein Pcinc_003694 [Petrolisthes cinctipes]|uniref:Uncharacterized protein n=1 Tax=Petrolisthes cinctipes TaxID=88211 RepID=A0AAE1L0Y2_PETCI|nr:hypothetical protein Pcinc_003694 [Petrolisthes cinctipes]